MRLYMSINFLFPLYVRLYDKQYEAAGSTHEVETTREVEPTTQANNDNDDEGM